MITLSQNESNLLYWCKHWYGDKMAQNYWQELKILCDEYFCMDCDVEDMYEAVRQLWKKIIYVLPNKELFLDQYESETLPSKARYYFGSPNSGSTNFYHEYSFNDEQMIRARVAKMVSQIGATDAKYYKSLVPEDIGELKVINRQMLEEAINEKNKNTP